MGFFSKLLGNTSAKAKGDFTLDSLDAIVTSEGTASDAADDKDFNGFRDNSPVWDAAQSIGLATSEFAQIFGITRAQASDIQTESVRLDEKAEAFLIFVMVLRTFMNDEKLAMQQWIRTDNISFGASPLDVMKRAGGMQLLRQYLEKVVNDRDVSQMDDILADHLS